MTKTLLEDLERILGSRHLHVGDRATRLYRKGYRYGDGEVLCVARPGSLLEQWQVMETCVAADVVMIFQAANTGLTGGSTPFGNDYDRPIVIINTMRNDRIDIIDDGRQVICMPGARLDSLERALKPLGREPHSVIGSSCIGASVTGGICNNSGGSLVQRGPSYTQLSLFAQVDETGRLRLVNHLGVELGEEPEEILRRLDAKDYGAHDIQSSANAWASDREYHQHVRDIESEQPARFNADPRRLYEASGSAGKIGIFATRLDTFVADDDEQVFYIGSQSPDELETIRRDILSTFEHLPIAGEYMHQDAYRISQRYGKDLFLFIKAFGTTRVPMAFAMKSRVDGLCERLGLRGAISDRILQGVASLFPDHMPKRLNNYRDRYTHHLILRTGGPCIAEMRAYLENRFPSETGAFIECTSEEGSAAFLNRFASGGAVVRYRAVNRRTCEGIVPLDVALPRNLTDWFESLPPEIESKIVKKVYVGHFLCHVIHQEYLVKKGEDLEALEHEILKLLAARGAEYPAEHNVGHLYEAKPALKAFYRELDPTNRFNPGIGKTSKRRNWADTHDAQV
ncbi:MAG: D-lactate dehydrogenase [Fulvimarina manganoxydans]|uniref:D-lactate dehydrogenase n=1 Tax=Fulvimarina manganoxydans TaxID=937218 RepID=UPI002354E350|nr:D-lactate dehydrogenase [Fulvimarina manganoxydans]MCK5934859.1 D-lactate dehydrogenase [Fulvimarina manganoxydans]